VADTQALITRAELFALGIEASRIKPKYLDEEDLTIEYWIRAASEKWLQALRSFMQLPLEEWGDGIKQDVAVIAAYEGKGVIGLPAAEEEYRQLKDRYDIAMANVREAAVRKVAPYGTVDSSEPDEEDRSTYSSVPRTAGYLKPNGGIEPW
jgi:hypothetical protein